MFQCFIPPSSMSCRRHNQFKKLLTRKKQCQKWNTSSWFQSLRNLCRERTAESSRTSPGGRTLSSALYVCTASSSRYPTKRWQKRGLTRYATLKPITNTPAAATTLGHNHPFTPKSTNSSAELALDENSSHFRSTV